jgi:hypothetical protein
MKPAATALGLALSAGLALAAAGADAEGPYGGRQKLESLSGVYASPQVEPWYGAYGTREFTFDKGAWALRFVFALDPEMKRKVFQFRTGGPYEIGAPSAAVPGAFEAVFFERAKYVTLLTDDQELIRKMRLADCGLAPNLEVDISAAGCGQWKPVAQCGEDHDLLAVDAAGKLYFGVRPPDNDMCTADRRPTALLGPVVRR